MPIASGFSQDLNPNYYVRYVHDYFNLKFIGVFKVRKPGKTELLDEAIYYKRDEQFERPVEVFCRIVRKILPLAFI